MSSLSHGWRRINFKLIKPDRLPLLITFDLIGKPWKVFVYFLIFNTFLCVSPAAIFVVLKQCLHYGVASFNYGGSGARDAEQFLYCIATCFEKQGLFSFASLLFFLFFFFRNSKIICKGTTEFKNYIVNIIEESLGKL